MTLLEYNWRVESYNQLLKRQMMAAWNTALLSRQETIPPKTFEEFYFGSIPPFPTSQEKHDKAIDLAEKKGLKIVRSEPKNQN